MTLLCGFGVATGPAAETILLEGFEGPFPGSNWTVGDDNEVGDAAYWGAVDASFGGETPHTGSFKGYCAAVGHGGNSTSPTYQDEMRAFMRRTLDLTNVISANLSFWYKAPSVEDHADVFSVFIDDTAIWATDHAESDWTKVVLNLTPYVGLSRVLSFEFVTDASAVLEGVYLDDIIVSGDVPPPNDAFTSARVIVGPAGALVDTTVGATEEAEEPDHAGDVGGGSIWYQWTAGTGGPMVIDTIGSDFDTLLAVYTGGSLGGLSAVAENNNVNPTNLQSRISFNAVADTVYHIAVDGSGAASGSLVLRWTQGALPDLMISQPPIPTVLERTLTPELCEVIEGCALAGTRRYLRFDTETRNIGTGDLFVGAPENNPLFNYAPCHGHYHFDAFAHYRLMSNNVLVAVGDKVGFCLVDGSRWDPDAPSESLYTCDFQGIQAGWADTYRAALPCQYIDITGVAPGNYTLELEIDPEDFFIEADEGNNVTQLPVTIFPPCLTIPTHDSFDAPVTLEGASVSTTDVNFCATRERQEPDHAGNLGGHSLWYTWTPPASGPAVISTEGTDFDTVLAVYTGDRLRSLDLVGEDNDMSSSNRQSSVSFNAVAGTSYMIAVDGAWGAVGEIQLNINPPANDHLDNCQPIAGSSGQVNGHTIGATAQAEEPAHGFPIGVHSVWYCWTAPSDGPVEFYTDQTSFETLLSVYSGDELHHLDRVALGQNTGNPPLQRAGFVASAGEEYRVAVDGSDAASGEFSLHWAMGVLPVRLVVLRNPSGALQVVLHGAPGTEHRVQHSGQLEQWDTLTTATIGEDGTVTIDLDPLPSPTQTFFRTTQP